MIDREKKGEKAPMETARRVFQILMVVVFSGIRPVAGQTLIENRNSPILKNPERVLKMETVFRVVDREPDFYFKNPWGLVVAVDGSFALGDEGQLLKFAPDGTFIKNMWFPISKAGHHSCSTRGELP